MPYGRKIGTSLLRKELFAVDDFPEKQLSNFNKNKNPFKHHLSLITIKACHFDR